VQADPEEAIGHREVVDPEPEIGAWRRSKRTRSAAKRPMKHGDLQEHRQASAERRERALLLHQLRLLLPLRASDPSRTSS
jgi:hypothetical protein